MAKTTLTITATRPKRRHHDTMILRLTLGFITVAGCSLLLAFHANTFLG